ncbi:hypothetical protein DFH09DRAFT_1083622 [Mycena vulgaris]|nr:hypothetical protein DFH09DRAFT_1083622 [Mycena vulgaris]
MVPAASSSPLAESLWIQQRPLVFFACAGATAFSTSPLRPRQMRQIHEVVDPSSKIHVESWSRLAPRPEKRKSRTKDEGPVKRANISSATSSGSNKPPIKFTFALVEKPQFGKIHSNRLERIGMTSLYRCAHVLSVEFPPSATPKDIEATVTAKYSALPAIVEGRVSMFSFILLSKKPVYRGARPYLVPHKTAGELDLQDLEWSIQAHRQEKMYKRLILVSLSRWSPNLKLDIDDNDTDMEHSEAFDSENDDSHSVHDFQQIWGLWTDSGAVHSTRSYFKTYNPYLQFKGASGRAARDELPFESRGPSRRMAQRGWPLRKTEPYTRAFEALPRILRQSPSHVLDLAVDELFPELKFIVSVGELDDDDYNERFTNRLMPAVLHSMDFLGDDSDRVVRAALLDSVDRFRTGFAGWAGDLAIMLGTLPTPICVVPADFLSIPTIEAIMAEVARHRYLQKTHSLRDRLEAVDETHFLVTRRRRHWIRHSLASFHSLPALPVRSSLGPPRYTSSSSSSSQYFRLGPSGLQPFIDILYSLYNIMIRWIPPLLDRELAGLVTLIDSFATPLHNFGVASLPYHRVTNPEADASDRLVVLDLRIGHDGPEAFATSIETDFGSTTSARAIRASSLLLGPHGINGLIKKTIIPLLDALSPTDPSYLLLRAMLGTFCGELIIMINYTKTIHGSSSDDSKPNLFIKSLRDKGKRSGWVGYNTSGDDSMSQSRDDDTMSSGSSAYEVEPTDADREEFSKGRSEDPTTTDNECPSDGAENAPRRPKFPHPESRPQPECSYDKPSPVTPKGVQGYALPIWGWVEPSRDFPSILTAAPRCGTSGRASASGRRGAAPVRAEIEVEIAPLRARGGHGEASAWASDSDADAEAGAETCECAECGLRREDDREEARLRVSAERIARGNMAVVDGEGFSGGGGDYALTMVKGRARAFAQVAEGEQAFFLVKMSNYQRGERREE